MALDAALRLERLQTTLDLLDDMMASCHEAAKQARAEIAELLERLSRAGN